MSTNYFAAPFVPWWDESKTGPAPSCETCGAVMVRVKGLDKGWECLSCGNYKADKDARKEQP